MCGQTALYLAAKNGHTEVVQLLIDFKANPLVLSKVSRKEFETPLDVACRWRHVNVVEILLNAASWSVKELRRARNLAGSKEIKTKINKLLNNKKSRTCRCSK